MRGKPQRAALNVLMVPCVGMALYLASVVIANQSFGLLGLLDANGSMQLAAPVTLVGLIVLAFTVRRVRRQHVGPAATNMAAQGTSAARDAQTSSAPEQALAGKTGSEAARTTTAIQVIEFEVKIGARVLTAGGRGS